MLTANDILTSSGKYPDRAKSPEVTKELLNNIELLLSKVNPFLAELGLTSVKVSSGFRTSAVNAATKGAAAKSNHMLGLAVDIEDLHGDLDALVGMNDVLLKKYGLWQEDSASTPSWLHLDIKDRGKRPKNVFKP